ncbi:hypothetical protein RJ639_020874, partial [Escallonia herrerae]
VASHAAAHALHFGQIAEIVDQGTSSCVACGALYALIAYFTGWQGNMEKQQRGVAMAPVAQGMSRY